jgi:hypothetical protein
MSSCSKLLLTLFAFSMCASVYADSGTFENIHCYSGQPQTLKHSETNVVNITMITGTVRATSPGQIFDNMSTQCAGLSGQMDGSMFSQGFCEWADSDGDRFFFRYERKGTEGTFRAVSGTGKYQGMAVDGSYVIMRFSRSVPVFCKAAHRTRGGGNDVDGGAILWCSSAT